MFNFIFINVVITTIIKIENALATQKAFWNQMLVFRLF